MWYVTPGRSHPSHSEKCFLPGCTPSCFLLRASTSPKIIFRQAPIFLLKANVGGINTPVNSCLSLIIQRVFNLKSGGLRIKNSRVSERPFSLPSKFFTLIQTGCFGPIAFSLSPRPHFDFAPSARRRVFLHQFKDVFAPVQYNSAVYVCQPCRCRTFRPKSLSPRRAKCSAILPIHTGRPCFVSSAAGGHLQRLAAFRQVRDMPDAGLCNCGLRAFQISFAMRMSGFVTTSEN